jgi:hypothetical protein
MPALPPTSGVPERTFGEAGLAESYDRLGIRLQDSTTGDPLLSLAETIEWLYALDQLHLEQSSLGPAVYDQTVRRTSTEGRTLRGLIFARGRSTHSLTTVGRLVVLPPRTPVSRRTPGPGGGYIMIGGHGGYSGYHWKLLSELPPATRPQYGADDDYRDLVQDRPLLGPLDAAIEFVRKLL